MPTLVNNILATTNNVGCYHGYKSVESTRSRTVNRISAPFPFLHLKPLAWRSLTCLSQKYCVLPTASEWCLLTLARQFPLSYSKQCFADTVLCTRRMNGEAQCPKD